MWMKSPKLSSGSIACAKSDDCASGTSGGAPQGAEATPDAEEGTTGDSGGTEADGGFECE